MGSKARIKKEILPLILKDRQPNQFFVDLMSGGMNLIDGVEGNRIANDLNFYLVEMWKEILKGWIPEDFYEREFYYEVKKNKEKFPPYLVGYLGFNCSYSGVWFGSFAGKVKTQINTIRNYQDEAKRNVLKQKENLKNVIFSNKNYYEVEIPKNSIVYFDPPYKDTSKYFIDFEHEKFYNYVRKLKSEGHQVFVSEYKMPEDFICIWEKEVKSSLSANGKSGSSKTSVEKLFTL